jgi:hypothetical protein
LPGSLGSADRSMTAASTRGLIRDFDRHTVREADTSGARGKKPAGQIPNGWDLPRRLIFPVQDRQRGALATGVAVSVLHGGPPVGPRRVGPSAVIMWHSGAAKEITRLKTFSPFQQKPRDSRLVRGLCRSCLNPARADIRAAEGGAGSDPQRANASEKVRPSIPHLFRQCRFQPVTGSRDILPRRRRSTSWFCRGL